MAHFCRCWLAFTLIQLQKLHASPLSFFKCFIFFDFLLRLCLQGRCINFTRVQSR